MSSAFPVKGLLMIRWMTPRCKNRTVLLQNLACRLGLPPTSVIPRRSAKRLECLTATRCRTFSTAVAATGEWRSLIKIVATVGEAASGGWC